MTNYCGITLAYLYPAADPLRDYTVLDYGEGPYIAYWDTAKLGPQPTEAFLASKEAEARVALVRRPRALSALRQEVEALAAADRQKLIVVVCCEFLQRHPKFAQMLNINIEGDEPIP